LITEPDERNEINKELSIVVIVVVLLSRIRHLNSILIKSGSQSAFVAVTFGIAV